MFVSYNLILIGACLKLCVIGHSLLWLLFSKLNYDVSIAEFAIKLVPSTVIQFHENHVLNHNKTTRLCTSCLVGLELALVFSMINLHRPLIYTCSFVAS